MDGRKEELKIFAHVVGADVPFLIGRRTLEEWGSRLYMVDGVLETEMSGEKRNFRIVITINGHYGMEMENEVCEIEEKWVKKRKKRREKRRQDRAMKVKMRKEQEMEDCDMCDVKEELAMRKESKGQNVQSVGHFC